ncbi:hypothetical protein [Streptomyces sp. NPDC046939]|uniref:hypothetical protein n=1 Tax=Streptomyces sp. NPDC046939 TaxID=3155376 RepID=UPI0033E4E20C
MTEIGLAGITGLKQPVTVPQLFHSEAAVASLLDHHINVRQTEFGPAVGVAVRNAVAAAVKDRGTSGGGPIPVDTELRLRVFIAHQGARQLRPQRNPKEAPAVNEVGAMRAAHLPAPCEAVRTSHSHVPSRGRRRPAPTVQTARCAPTGRAAGCWSDGAEHEMGLGARDAPSAESGRGRCGCSRRGACLQ